MLDRHRVFSAVIFAIWGAMILACGGSGSTQEAVPQELRGKWRPKSYELFGKPESDHIHVSWEFLDGGRVKIVTPAYKGLPEDSMDRSIEYLSGKRFQVYNLAGSKRFNLFSGIWSVGNGELTLKFNTGDSFPSEVNDPSRIEAKLVLSKSPHSSTGRSAVPTTVVVATAQSPPNVEPSPRLPEADAGRITDPALPAPQPVKVAEAEPQPAVDPKPIAPKVPQQPQTTPTPAPVKERPRRSAGTPLERAFVGRWRIVGQAGRTATHFTLTDSFEATKAHAPGVSGTWQVVGSEARITWSDGWKDILRPQRGLVYKIAFTPGTDWTGRSANTQGAVKVP